MTMLPHSFMPLSFLSHYFPLIIHSFLQLTVVPIWLQIIPTFIISLVLIVP